MNIKRFSIVFGLVAAAGTAVAAPPHLGDTTFMTADAGIVLVQSFKERQLEDLPAVDAGRAQPPGSRPPPPPPVPPAPRVTSRSAPPPAGGGGGGGV